MLNSAAEGEQPRLSDRNTSSVYIGWFGFPKEKECSLSPGIDLDPGPIRELELLQNCFRFTESRKGVSVVLHQCLASVQNCSDA